MNVQELIDILSKVKDKTKPLYLGAVECWERVEEVCERTTYVEIKGF